MRTGSYVFLATLGATTCVAQAETIRLANGDVVTGAVTATTDTAITLEHPALGNITIARTAIAEIAASSAGVAGVVAPTGSDAPPAPQPPATAAPVPGPAGAAAGVNTTPSPETPSAEPRGLFGTGLFRGWDMQLTAGINGTAGNSDTVSAVAKFKASFEDAENRWLWDNSYFLTNETGERSQNEFRSELTRDWLIPGSPWFYFLRGIYEYDEFEDWQHRASGFAGVGYTFIKQDKFELNGRIGAGLTKEFKGDRELTPEALVGATLVRYRLTPNQTISGSATFFPALDELGEFRLTTGLEYELKLNTADGLSFKIGIENEYESDVDEDESNNDLKYYGALVYDF